MKVEMDGEDYVPKTGRDSVIKTRSDNVDILNDISDALQDINSSDVSNRSCTGSPASEEQSEFDAENEKPFSSSKSPSSSSSILLNDTHFQRTNSWNSDGLSTTSSSRSTTSVSDSFSWSTSGISSCESRNENHKSETPSPRKPPTTHKSSSMEMKSGSMISSRKNWGSGSSCKENNPNSSSGFFSSSSLSSSSSASFLRSSSSASFSRSSSHASSLFQQLDQNGRGKLSSKVVKSVSKANFQGLDEKLSDFYRRIFKMPEDCYFTNMVSLMYVFPYRSQFSSVLR